MRATTEIGELSDLIEGDNFSTQVLDQLDFVFFLLVAEPFNRICTLNFGALKWQSLTKCINVRQLIVVISITLIKETEKVKSPREHNLKICPRAGNAQSAEPVLKHLNHLLRS